MTTTEPNVEKQTIGCGQQRPFFGAYYPDGVCIDGWMWDLDSCESPGGPLFVGGDYACPNCNAEVTNDEC